MTTREAMEYLECSRRRLYKARISGKIKPKCDQRRFYSYEKADLDALAATWKRDEELRRERIREQRKREAIDRLQVNLLQAFEEYKEQNRCGANPRLTGDRIAGWRLWELREHGRDVPAVVLWRLPRKSLTMSKMLLQKCWKGKIET